MNFDEQISDFVLGNLSFSQLPSIALAGLHEGLDSESLAILAGMESESNTFELQSYFEKALYELEYVLPSREESAKTLLKYYLNKMLAAPDDAFEVFSIIDRQIYNGEIEWRVKPEKSEETYVGQELGLERMYTWYREFQDLEDGINLYYTDLALGPRKVKFQEHLLEEGRNLLKKLVDE